jgi:hypothetical protein
MIFCKYLPSSLREAFVNPYMGSRTSKNQREVHVDARADRTVFLTFEMILYLTI